MKNLHDQSLHLQIVKRATVFLRSLFGVAVILLGMGMFQQMNVHAASAELFFDNLTASQGASGVCTPVQWTNTDGVLRNDNNATTVTTTCDAYVLRLINLNGSTLSTDVKNLPWSAVTGIEVKSMRKTSRPAITEDRLWNLGGHMANCGTAGNEKCWSDVGTQPWTLTYSVATYGGPNNKWNDAKLWDPNQTLWGNLQDAQFRVNVHSTTGVSIKADIEYVSLTVYYNAPVDTTPPEITMNDLPDATNVAIPSVGGTVVDLPATNASGVKNVQVIVRRNYNAALPNYCINQVSEEWDAATSTWIPCTSGQGLIKNPANYNSTTGTWTFNNMPTTANLDSGKLYYVFYRACDNNGNCSHIPSNNNYWQFDTFIYETTRPQVFIDVPNVAELATPPTIISGHATDEGGSHLAKVLMILRKNLHDPLQGMCTDVNKTDIREWNGTAWVNPCTVGAMQKLETRLNGVNTDAATWQYPKSDSDPKRLPNASEMEPGVYWIYAQAKDGAGNTSCKNPSVPSTDTCDVNWVSKTFTYAPTLPPTLTVQPTSFYGLPASGGQVSFTITSNVSWTVTSNQAWATVSPTSGSNNGSVTVTYAANPTTSVRVAGINVAGGPNPVVVTLSQNGSGTSGCGKMGDVNCDGVVNGADILIIADYLVGKITDPTQVQRIKQYGDVNCDTLINGSDILKIADYLVGKTTLPDSCGNNNGNGNGNNNQNVLTLTSINPTQGPVSTPDNPSLVNGIGTGFKAQNWVMWSRMVNGVETGGYAGPYASQNNGTSILFIVPSTVSGGCMPWQDCATIPRTIVPGVYNVSILTNLQQSNTKPFTVTIPGPTLSLNITPSSVYFNRYFYYDRPLICRLNPDGPLCYPQYYVQRVYMVVTGVSSAQSIVLHQKSPSGTTREYTIPTSRISPSTVANQIVIMTWYKAFYNSGTWQYCQVEGPLSTTCESEIPADFFTTVNTSPVPVATWLTIDGKYTEEKEMRFYKRTQYCGLIKRLVCIEGAPPNCTEWGVDPVVNTCLQRDICQYSGTTTDCNLCCGGCVIQGTTRTCLQLLQTPETQ